MATQPTPLAPLPAPLLRRVIGPAVAAWVLALSGAAVASPNFPDVVQKVAGSNCAPSCLLCHVTNPGRKGTAVQKFAIGLIGKGISGGQSDAVVRAALIKMRDGVPGNPNAVPPVPATPPSDLDSDGITDFTELGMNINPNPGKAELCEIAYGCGARIAPAPPPSRLALFSSAMVALGLVWMGVRARRPTRR